jgi:hypothetical protein
MIDTRIRIVVGATVLTACALGALWPTAGLANLAEIACQAIKNDCDRGCDEVTNVLACYKNCGAEYQDCVHGHTTKQQTPPPPCRGIHCTLRPTHPPTTVSDPAHPPRHPVEPVKPVGVSNPNKTNTGNGGPVILLRKNDSGNGQGHGHGH